MKPYLKWAIPLAFGMLLPLSYLVFSHFNDPDLGGARQSTIADLAKRDGQDVKEGVDTYRINSIAEDKRTIDDHDYRRLWELCHSSNEQTRYEAVTGLGYLGNTPHKNEILSLVRPLLSSRSGSDQAAALIVLWKLHDSSWKSEAQTRLTNKDESIASAARLITQRGELPHTWNLH